MTEVVDETASAQRKSYALFGGLVLIAMIVALVFALHTIFSLRPRVIP